MPSRLRRQRVKRQSHVSMIVKHLTYRLSSKRHAKRIETTNRLLPLGNLRRSCLNQIFSGWILNLVGEGRVLTRKLAGQVCVKLRKALDLPLNETDHQEEVKRMHLLLKGARKRQIGKQGPSVAMSGMDNMETLLMEEIPPPNDQDLGFRNALLLIPSYTML